MLRPFLFPRAVAALRRLSVRATSGWTPHRNQEFPAAAIAAAGAAAAHPAALTMKSRVFCRNWQRFGSCRYGARCVFVEGHVDTAVAKPRSIGQR